MAIWDWTKTGLEKIPKGVVTEAIKMVIAGCVGALAAYGLHQVDYLSAHLHVGSHYYQYEIALMGAVRAMMEGLHRWVTTYGIALPVTGTTDVPQG